MSEIPRYRAKYGDLTTLPLYCMMFKSDKDVPRFSKGDFIIQNIDPGYTPFEYKATPELINMLGRDPAAAITAVQRWWLHVTRFMYFVQFKDDETHQLIQALHDHTETLSTLCDSRLKLDPTPLWNHFDKLSSFANVHDEYRDDPERDAKWEHYASRLKHVHDRMDAEPYGAYRLVQRMQKQIELQAANWPSLPAICVEPNAPITSARSNLFYSYSHKDEFLRDQLHAHLSLLRRQNVIAEWHDRRISAGREWEGQIDQNLNDARIILLLISADFLVSDYCYDVELNRAMDRHNAGEARVIPVILRACDWHGAPFGKLQAVPTDAKPVTSWKNIDEAFTNVAKEIRKAVMKGFS